MTPLETVRARLAEIAPEIRSLATVETRDAAQDARWTEVTTEFEELEARQAELVQREEMAARAATINFIPPAKDVDETRDAPVEVRTAALRAVETSKYYTRTEHREAVSDLIEREGDIGDLVAKIQVAAGGKDYRRAWAKMMCGHMLDNDEARAVQRVQDVQRAMTVGTTTSGGFLVPPYLDPTMIITGAGSANPFRRVSNVKQLAYGNTWKGVTAGQISASFDTEASEVSDDTATLAQPSIPVFLARAFIPASFETFEDVDNLAADVAMLFVDGKDVLEASSFATGNGTSAPKGVMTAVGAVTASRVASATGGTYAVADIYNVQQALPPRHRLNSAATRAWMMNVKTINSTRQFATANNYHAFLVDLGAGQPSQLIGDQLFEASSVTSTVTTGNDLMVYGDFNKYLIVDKIGMTVEFIPNLFSTGSGRPTSQRAWLAHWRVGADAVDADAFRTLRL